MDISEHLLQCAAFKVIVSKEDHHKFGGFSQKNLDDQLYKM